MEDAVKLGEEIEVKVIAVDSMGRINLSRRALTDKTRAKTTEESQRLPLRCYVCILRGLIGMVPLESTAEVRLARGSGNSAQEYGDLRICC